jgi:hypothetical protein
MSDLEDLAKHNKIIYTTWGAVDYTEQIVFELYLEDLILKRKIKFNWLSGNGDKYEQINYLNFMRLMYLPHCEELLISNLIKIFDKTLPNGKDMLYVKCYRKYHHSHQGFGTPSDITKMTIEDAMEFIKEDKMTLKLYETSH